MPQLKLPPPLSAHLNGIKHIQLNSKTLAELPQEIKHHHPKAYELLFTQQGKLNGYVNIFLHQKRISDFQENYTLNSNDILEVVVSISGG